MPKRAKAFHHHIDKKLQFRFWLFVLISLVMLAIIGYDVLIGTLSSLFALEGILVGIFIGLASSRMFHFSWDHDVKKVIARLDWVGGIILVLYIVIAIFRAKLVGVVVHGPQVAPAGLAVVAGTMAGRVIGMRTQIRKVLKAQGIF